ncbi:MAG: peptidylprolyl isomerase [Proteobacteria bacterium]|nr:peptidylprolyl isomerase [Pseudomonadota bacterium]
MPAWIQRLGLIVIVALIVGAFVITGVGQQAAPGLGAVASVRGEEITRDRFEWIREQTEQAFGQTLADLEPRQRRELLDNQTRASLIRRYLLAQEAESLGLGVYDDELQRDLWENPQFQEDGQYSREFVEALAAGSGLGVRGLADEYRRDVLLRKFRRLVESPIRISRAGARWALLREQTSVTLRYALATADQYRPRVEIDSDAPRELLESDPERVRDRYQEQIETYRRPEEVRARHILFTGENASEQAEQAKADIAQGGDFEALAREQSRDEATREQAGDLGWFPRGIMVPEFDEMAFSTEPGQVSAPVETEHGVHLIRVEERRAELDLPFAEVRESLAREILIEEKAGELAKTAAQYILDHAREGQDFVQAARDVDLDATLTVPFRLSDREIPGLPASEQLLRAAFDLTPEQPLATRVFGADGRYYAAILDRREEPNTEDLEAELQDAREQMTQNARSEISTLWYRVRLEQARQASAIEQYSLAR